ncbi:MAG TPA: YicC/YloC family endoribonuclease [Gammaproteobacteria bacterium]|nr:YicC/YloC family endoribonuclease [Gammaproteobacteria bacterium]
MIQSMTAFARAQSHGEWGSAVCEMRSVNHRYLEFRIHLPEALSGLEQAMQEVLREQLKRGKVECYFRFQPGATTEASLQVNPALIKRLVELNRELVSSLPGPLTINSMDILQWPGVMQSSEINLESIYPEFMKLLKLALQDLLTMRQREGEELKVIFLHRLDELQKELGKAKERLPFIVKFQRERLLKHFHDAGLEMDKQRLEQEMVMFSQKIDVTEEIERIETHVAEVRRILKEGGLIGRRLDFLMQELNREANTLGAKSVDVDTTRASLEMKVLIEQLREQMQNIE